MHLLRVSVKGKSQSLADLESSFRQTCFALVWLMIWSGDNIMLAPIDPGQVSIANPG